MKVGDRLITVGATGGGYGDPLLRDPQLVLDDVCDGYYSREAAERDYGVIISGEMKLDVAGTEGYREGRKAEAENGHGKDGHATRSGRRGLV
jgi:N-methylhydantoinase B/oxoprolinase/acetone carboxylase alpha subunit